jgi:hypothetical protein
MKNIQIALSLARASDNGDKSPLFGGNTHGLARLCHRCHRLSPQIQYRQREQELSKGRRTKTTGTRKNRGFPDRQQKHPRKR